MFKIISKSKYEAMLTQIEGLKSVCVRQQDDIDKIRSNNLNLKDRYYKLEKEADRFRTKAYSLLDELQTVKNGYIKLAKEYDESSKLVRNRDLVTGRFIKNRK